MNRWEKVRGRFSVTLRETPLFDSALRLPTDVANSYGGDISMTLVPFPQWQTEVGVRHTTLKRQLDNSTYSTATIPRVRTQYQFTRAIYARMIFEYGSQDRGELRDPTTGRPVVSRPYIPAAEMPMPCWPRDWR